MKFFILFFSFIVQQEVFAQSTIRLQGTFCDDTTYNGTCCLSCYTFNDSISFTYISDTYSWTDHGTYEIKNVSENAFVIKIHWTKIRGKSANILEEGELKIKQDSFWLKKGNKKFFAIYHKSNVLDRISGTKH